MLRLLTDLNLINRFDVKASADLAAGTDGSNIFAQGTWAVKSGDELIAPAADGAAGALAIFTESNRDGSAGWAPDATAYKGGGQAGQLTVLHGKFRALTSEYAAGIAAGDKLIVEADTGKLKKAAASAGDPDQHIVAVCTKAEHALRHLGADTNVIEILTV